MTKTEHELNASLHSEAIAQHLMAADRAILPDDRAARDAEWRGLWPVQREDYRRQARMAVRGSSDTARAVASFEAREIFCKAMRWLPNSFQESAIAKAFEDALCCYQTRLADGPFPMREETPDEGRAYLQAVRPVDDDDPETVTGHGRN